MGLIKNALNLVRDITVEIVAGLLAGYAVYLYFGNDIEEKLVKLYPNLPVLLLVLIGIAFLGAMFVKLVKSISYHRLLEKDMSNLQTFLEDWDELGNTFGQAIQSRTNPQPAAFEAVRARLIFNYPKVTHLTRTMRYDKIDRIVGIHTRNYDVIGNLLAQSPFSGTRWGQLEFKARDFRENWDLGRTILVALFGHLNPEWNTIWHKILQSTKLVPKKVKLVEENEVE